MLAGNQVLPADLRSVGSNMAWSTALLVPQHSLQWCCPAPGMCLFRTTAGDLEAAPVSPPALDAPCQDPSNRSESRAAHRAWC